MRLIKVIIKTQYNVIQFYNNNMDITNREGIVKYATREGIVKYATPYIQMTWMGDYPHYLMFGQTYFLRNSCIQ